MLLSQLAAAVPGASIAGPDVRVGRVTDRDSEVVAGDVFVAIRGARVDGHDRIAGLARAAAVVVDHEVLVPPGPSVLRVTDTRRALAHLCAARHDHPGRAMAVVAVTGTNGKTSVTYLLASIARAHGWLPGIIGTTGHRVGEIALPAEHTTPTAPIVQDLLAQMRDHGCQLVAMEASSIGLCAYRCDAIPFRAAVFTNLTRDHLDVHGTMEAYAAAKSRLFHELLDGTAILNARDPASVGMAPADRPTWWFHGRDLSAEAIESGLSGTTMIVHTPAGSVPVALRLLGAYAVDNALAAIGAALAVGVPLQDCAAGVGALANIPGRLERVANDRGFVVLVDYAHTPDALAQALDTLRALAGGRVICVMGCGGDRDAGKRAPMGDAAAARADLVVVTDDNPRGEDAAAIRAAVLDGVAGRPHAEIGDRREAIAYAIGLARAGDVVLLAGKGHEAYQEVAGARHPFDDRAVAAEVLS